MASNQWIQTKLQKLAEEKEEMERQITESESLLASNQLIQTKLQKLAEEKEEEERQISELESCLASRKKRLELIDEHASALHSLKSMEITLSVVESIEAMVEKIQDKKVEGIENIRYIHLHILDLEKKCRRNSIKSFASPLEYFSVLTIQVNLTEKIYQFRKRNLQTNYLKFEILFLKKTVTYNFL